MLLRLILWLVLHINTFREKEMEERMEEEEKKKVERRRRTRMRRKRGPWREWKWWGEEDESEQRESTPRKSELCLLLQLEDEPPSEVLPELRSELLYSSKLVFLLRHQLGECK